MKKVRMALLLLLLLMSTINYYQVSNLFDLDNPERDEEKQLNYRKIPLLASNSTVIAERIRNHNQAIELQSLGEQNLENQNKNKTMYSGIRLPSYKITSRGPIDIDNDTAFGPSGYNFTGSGTEIDPYIIEEYNITDSTTTLIDIQDTTVYFVIRDSILNGITGTNFGINLFNVTHGIIENNTIQNEDIGILLSYLADNITISNNIICNNTEIGIVVGVSANNTISGNFIYNNTMAGIVTNSSDFNTIIGNIIYNNTDGIWLDASANHSILDNQVFNNSQFGCFLRFGGNHTVSGNNIYNNSFLGVHINLSSNNQIDRNNFIDNDPSRGPDSQAKDNGSSNVFIYNYWNEWTSPDSDNNGYVDDVYYVNGTAGNSDSFPLVSPFNGYIPYAPISITSNSDFGPLNYDFPGAGTLNNPYLIEGYNITDSTDLLIGIENTDVYFVIRDNVLDGVTATQVGINLLNARNGSVERNIIHSTVRAIVVQGSSSYNNIVFNNQIYNNSLDGIHVTSSSHDNVISRNVVYNCSDHGILQDGSSGNTTIANNIVFNCTYSGIKIGGFADNNTVANNTVFNTAKTSPNAGIYFDWSDNNTIFNNTIYNNSNSGLIILNSNYNNVTSNTLINNTQYGIWIWVSSNNYISRNVLTDNIQYGIFVDSSSAGNTLELNNFFGNNQGSTQANDAGSSNTFIYNYWDDHTGPDTTPFDGYIDNPYNIDGGSNTDSFPRAYPLFPHAPININDNADFTTVGFPGQGTINDPYVIEEYFIINSTTTLIYIQDTTAYFIIRYNNLNSIDVSNIGIYLQNVTNGYIHNNSIQNGTYGIKLVTSDNNTLTYNNVSNSGSPLDSGGIVIQEGSDYNILKGNEVYNCTTPDTYAISLHNSDHNLVENNQIYNDYSGLKLDSSDFNNVSYNIIDEIFGTTNSIGLWGQVSNNNTFSYNIITDNNYEPFYLYDSDYNILEGNIIANNSRSGIDLHSNSIYNQIRNNTIYNQVQQAAVRLRDYSADNIITNNTFYQNKWGILCGWGGGQGGCDNNDIINNTIIDQTDYGIQMEKASYNLIGNNTISNNALAGIYFVSSSGYNTIYSNNILNNIGGQAIDDNGTNEFQKNGWGNYWGIAYSGLDENYDGIGDTPYAFSGNQDPFPVTNPIDWYFQFNFTSIQGDWNVIASETHQNEYITLTGNLLISSTGFLNFTNVILRMNCSSDGQYRVEVANGGFFQTNTNSTITPFNKSHVWYFKANDGSSITLHDSKFVFAGWEMGTNGDHSGMWVNANNANIRNCIFQHNYHGLFLYQRNRHVISQNNFSSNTLYGLYVQTSSNNEISGNAFSNNEIAMYMISDSDNNTLSGNIVIFNLGHGFYIDGNTNNNTIFNNSISANGDESIHAGISLRNCHNNSVINNYVINNNHHGIRLTNADNNTITNNSVYGNGENGFLISECENNTINENNIHDNSNGFTLEGTYLNQIYNNTIYSNGNGFGIFRANNDVIYNNSISNNVWGIQLYYSFTKVISHNITIELNSFNSNSIGAIIMNNVSDCIVQDNEFNLNSGYGIYLIANSSDNTLSGNVIRNSSDYGVYLDSTTINNTISLNEFYFNKLGNAQAYDDGSFNSFTFNFWNEWTTPDTNADWIVDITYVIDGTVTNTDDYPRVYPYIVPHNPIYIDEDADFATLGFSGQGIPSDPYRIEYYFIINSTSTLISIQDTNVYFIIRNNSLDGISGTPGTFGIYLYNVINGAIINNTIHSGSRGINIDSSLNINITSNCIFNESNQGIFLFRSYAMNLSQNDIYNITGTGIYLSYTNGSLVSENTISDNSQSGITLFSTYNNKISKNYVFNNSQYGIFIDSSIEINSSSNIVYNNQVGIYLSSSSNDNTIINNSVFINNFQGIFLDNSFNNNITENVVYNNTQNGIYLSSSSNNNKILNNTIFNNTNDGLYILSSSDNILQNNSAYLNTRYGIFLQNANSNDLFDNTIFNNTGHAIYLINSAYNNLSKNYLHDNNNVGIYLQSASFNNLSSNIINNQREFGIRLMSSSNNNTIYNNRIVDNGYTGIHLWGSNHTTIYKNYLSQNGWEGIALRFSENTNITYNRIIGSTWGIFISSDDNFNNLIERNSFIDNYQAASQAFDDDSTKSNIFRYNHWNDWVTPDNDQNYIVDNPYPILGSASNTDPFPLTYVYITRDPIYIDDNSDFITLGFHGSGTVNDPYLIDGFNITDISFSLIYIEFTTAYFVISNNILSGTSGWNGIELRNVSHGIITSNIVRYANHGIYLYGSDNITIQSNKPFDNTWYGIALYASKNCSVLENNVYDNVHYGIALYLASSNNTVSHNNIYNTFYDTADQGIVVNTGTYNTVNNNTIIHYKTGIMLVSSANNNDIIDNNIFNNTNYGISIYNSLNNTVYNNLIYNQSKYGIYLLSSNETKIVNNVIYNNSMNGIHIRSSYYNNVSSNIVINNSNYGILLSSASNNSVWNNTLYNNSWDGIKLETLANYNILSNNTIYNNQQGIFVNNGSINIIVNNTIYSNFGNGIKLDNNSTKNDIENNTIFNNTNCGIYLSYSDNSTITDNFVYNNSNDGIYLGSSEYNTISNNRIFNNSFNGINLWNVTSNNLIINNVISNNSQQGIRLQTANHSRIVSNTISDNFLYGIALFVSNNSIITGNTLFNNNPTGIWVTDNSTSNVIADNNISFNTQYGIHFKGLNVVYNIIANNTIYNNSVCGVLFEHTSHNRIVNNTIFNHSVNGIQIWNTTSAIFNVNNSIFDNLLFNNLRGIYLANTNNSLIQNNEIINNEYGLWISSSYNNSVINTFISGNNGYGIYLYSSTSFTNITSNQFINNNPSGLSQAKDDGSNNSFNLNYWDNHTSPDNNIDGIVDIPYAIDGLANNYDFNPLVYLSEPHAPIYIDENADFKSLGFLGQGTIGDPYIIENYFISSSTTTLIHIQDTTAYFIVRDNILISLTGGNDSIYLNNVTQGTIIDNLIHNARFGIHLLSSINNTLSRNSIYNNTYHSIYLLLSSENNVSYNNVFNNSRNGITVSYSDNNVLSYNIVANNSQYGIVLFEAHDNSVFNNTIYNNTLDGIILTNSTTRTTLVNNTVYNNSRYGIMLAYYSTDNNISFNDIYGNLGTGIVLYLYCSSNILSNNKIYSNFKAGIGAVNSSSNNILLNNYIFNNSWNGIGLINSSNNNIISFNEIHHNLWNGIFVNASSSHNTLSDNTLYNNSENGILLETSAFNNTVVSNSIYNNSLDGIAIDGAHNNTLLNNVIQDQYKGISLTYSLNTTCSYNSIYNSSYDSIYLYYANYTTIIGNNVSNNAFDGMFLGNSYHNIIINNTFSNNSKAGIYIGFSGFNLVMTNLISNHLDETNAGIGILVSYSINNTISNNTISDNVNFGIFLSPFSANNTIKWNDFVNNNLLHTLGLGTSQAYDNGTSNLFLNNFWSDWTSPDTNPVDGIVDYPYIINGSANNFDPYPLAFTAIHDLSIPTVRYPNDGGVFGGEIILQWDPAIDSWNHSITYTLFYSSDGGGTWTPIDSDWKNTNYTWDTTSPLVLNGTNFLIQVNATCSTGLWQVDTSDFVFTINNVLDDTLPPEIIISPSNSSYVELTTGHTITWTATDQFPDTYSIWLNNTPIQNYIDVNWNNNIPITINIDNLSPGLYIYKIEFVDTSGNPSVHEVWVTVTENAPPIVTITQPNQDDILDGTIAIAWTAIDPEGQPMTYSVDYWNGNSWINLATSLSTTATTWDTTIVIDRPDYKIRVNASDGYKIGINESGVFTIDNIESFAQIPAGFTKFEVTDTITVGLDVKNSVNVTINRLSDSDVPDPPSDLESLNIYLNITISDTDALNELWINISFAELDVQNPDNVKIYFFDERLDRWEEVKSTGVDFEREVVWGMMEHLTLFGVMDEQTQPADDWRWLVMTLILITPVIVVTVFIYRRAKKGMRMKKAKAEIRQSQIDLGILTRDLDQD